MATKTRQKNEKSKPLRCGAYCRVSTTNQILENDSSIDTQLRAIHRRAEYETSIGRPWLVTEYKEEGRSAKDTKRPALQRLLADVRAGKLDAVVVTKIDRISRSLIDFFELTGEFESHGVEFIAINDDFETRTPIGRATLKIVLVLAELERERTSERISEKIAARQAQGLFFGGVIALGYRSHPTDKTSLEIDPDEAKIVKLIYSKFLEIKTGHGVARYLNSNGITQPRNNAPFRASGVSRILSNRIYVAEREYQGEIISCNWKPIIPKTTYDKVQKLIAANSVSPPKGRPSAIVPLLAGLLRCSCGAVMGLASGKSRTGARHHYYACRNKQLVPGTCRTKDIPLNVVESFVIEQVKGLALSGVAIAEAVKAANGSRDSELAAAKAELETARQAQGAKSEVVNRLVDAIAGGSVAKALARRLAEEEQALEELKDRTLDLSTKVQALQSVTLNAAVVEDSYRTLARSLTLALEAGQREVVRSLLASLIDSITWKPGSKAKTGHASINLFPIPGVEKGRGHLEGQWFPEMAPMVGHGDRFTNHHGPLLRMEVHYDFRDDLEVSLAALLRQGVNKREIARRTGVSLATVKRHGRRVA